MKDYAKTQRHKKKKGMQPLFFCIAIGCLLVSAIFLHHHKKPIKQNHSQKKTTEVKKPTLTHQSLSEKKIVANKPIKFDFYHLLAESTINTDPDSNAHSKKSTAIHNYALQVAAVKTLPDVKRIQTQFNLAGYDTFIQSHQAPDHTKWFRVMIGPFKTSQIAKLEQNKLYSQNIASILLKK